MTDNRLHSVHADRLAELEAEARANGWNERDARMVAGQILSIDRIAETTGLVRADNVVDLNARRTA